MSTIPRVVVLVGTGHFGARICRRLSIKQGFDLVLVSKLLSDDLSRPGAYACLRMFTLDELTRELADFDVNCTSPSGRR